MQNKQNLEKLSHEYDSYIKTVLKNFRKDHIRKNRSKWENECYLEDLSFSTRENLMKTENEHDEETIIMIDDRAYTKKMVKNAVDLLPSKKSIVINLYFYDELSEKKIADMLGLSIMGVSKRKKEALKLLKELLEDADYEQEK